MNQKQNQLSTSLRNPNFGGRIAFGACAIASVASSLTSSAAAAGDDEGGQAPNEDTPRHGRTTWTGCRRPAP